MASPMESPQTSDAPTGYVPGVCNIGPAETRLRRRMGWAGVGFTLVLWSVFIARGTPPMWRLTLFVPAAMATVGLLQSAWHFCAAFGLLSVLNVGMSLGRTDTVEQAAFRRQDRRKALTILALSMAMGLAVAAAGFLIPI